MSDKLSIMIFGLLTFLLLFLSCQSNPEVAINTQEITEIPDQEGWDATLISTSDGKISSKIKYTRMQGYSGKDLIKFSEGVEIEFYDREGEQISTVSSDKAELNERNNNMELTGNVAVHSSDGTWLFTEHLQWNDLVGKIRTDEPVMFINVKNDTIYGQGFESENSLQKWVIKNPTGTSQKRLLLNVDEQE